MKPIKECPHCHSPRGVFTKTDLINVPTNYNFDGSRAYNGEMYDNAERIIDKSMVYCQKCGKAICRWITFCERNNIPPY